MFHLFWFYSLQNVYNKVVHNNVQLKKSVKTRFHQSLLKTRFHQNHFLVNFESFSASNFIQNKTSVQIFTSEFCKKNLKTPILWTICKRLFLMYYFTRFFYYFYCSLKWKVWAIEDNCFLKCLYIFGTFLGV